MTISLAQLETELQDLQESAQSAIAAISDLGELEQLRLQYFGKKGQLSQILRNMGKLTPEERPRIGALSNNVKEILQSQLDQLD